MRKTRMVGVMIDMLTNEKSIALAGVPLNKLGYDR